MGLVAHDQGGVLYLDLVAPALVLIAAAAGRRRDSMLLAAAGVALAAVTLPPIHQIAERSVAGHMVQHLAIIIVAAPLIGFVAAEAPSRLRGRRPVRTLANVAIAPAYAPLAAGAAHAVVLVGWHVPSLYDAAVGSWFVHGIEHFTMLASGVWWWATVVHHTARRAPLPAVGSLFAVATMCAVLGVLMMFAPGAWYAQGGVDDQRLAGAAMSGASGAIGSGTAMLLVARAVRRLETPRRPRLPLPRPPLFVVAGAMTAGIVGLVDLSSSRETDAGPAPTAADNAADEDLGRDLYRRDCAACHGPAGEGTNQGEPLEAVGPAGVFYALSTGRMPIPRPGATIGRSEPAYTTEEIHAIVAHTATFLDAPEVPEIDVEGADVARGGSLYRLHCAACHGGTGIGGAQAFEGDTTTFDRAVPPVLNATPMEVAAAMVAGPGVMPTFQLSFDEADLAAVAAYVQVIQDPPTRGVPVPGSRVAEGLIAWLVGIGVLVAAAMWTGRRA